MKTYENIRKDGCNFCRFIRNENRKHEHVIYDRNVYIFSDCAYFFYYYTTLQLYR